MGNKSSVRLSSSLSGVFRLATRLRESVSRFKGLPRHAGSVFMFLPINGAGLGHLTRCIAIARQLRLQQPNAQIIFVTTSIATSLVHQFGFVCHHITPFRLSSLHVRDWNNLLARTVDQLVQMYRPEVFIFDGSGPYAGLQSVMKRHRNIKYVWIRREGFKPTVNQQVLENAQRCFAKVLKPMEPSQVHQVGKGFTQIPPVLIYGPDELYEAEYASLALGVHNHFVSGKKFVYIQLGAGNINEKEMQQREIAAYLQSRGFVVIVGKSPISLGTQENPEFNNALHVVRDYPNSRYFALFDFAVLAGGYNSVCEAVGAGLPAIFLPNLDTLADDQLARVNGILDHGIYEALTSPFEPFRLKLDRLIDRIGKEPSKGRVAFDGATQAAKILASLARTVH